MMGTITTLGSGPALAISDALAVFTAAALMLGQCSGGTSPATANARAIEGHGSQCLFGAISAFPWFFTGIRASGSEYLWNLYRWTGQ
jgi:hypothetical protein